MTGFWLTVAFIVVGTLAWKAGQMEGRRQATPQATADRIDHLLDELDAAVATTGEMAATIQEQQTVIRSQSATLRDLRRPRLVRG